MGKKEILKDENGYYYINTNNNKHYVKIIIEKPSDIRNLNLIENENDVSYTEEEEEEEDAASFEQKMGMIYQFTPIIL